MQMKTNGNESIEWNCFEIKCLKKDTDYLHIVAHDLLETKTGHRSIFVLQRKPKKSD